MLCIVMNYQQDYSDDLKYWMKIVEKQLNSTLDNALSKMIYAYKNGITLGKSCYAVVGDSLCKMDPENAIIRLWG